MSRTEHVLDVFEALGLPDTEELMARANLASILIGVVHERGLSYDAVATLLRCDVTRVEKFCNADLDSFTIDELCRYLVSLGQDVQIAVKPAGTTDGHFSVVA